MKILIPRVPPSTTRRELFDLVSNLLRKRLHIPFTPYPRVTSCHVVEIRDALGIVDHHGIIAIDSDAAGQWLINHFKGQRLKNKLIHARKYVKRNGNGMPSQIEGERRRPHLQIDMVSAPRISY